MCSFPVVGVWGSMWNSILSLPFNLCCLFCSLFQFYMFFDIISVTEFYLFIYLFYFFIFFIFFFFFVVVVVVVVVFCFMVKVLQQDLVCILYLSRSTTKPTKWPAVRPAKTQRSLGIRPVWSESSLSTKRNLGSLATHWAHADLSLRWAHRPYYWFCHVAAHFECLAFSFIFAVFCFDRPKLPFPHLV